MVNRDLVGYGRNVPKVWWPNDARIAVSLVINYEEGSELSLLDGDERNESLGELPSVVPPSVRDLRTESVFEYGSRAGIWRLLRLVDKYDVKVTVFATAVALERNPAVARAVQRSGHEVCGHGWRWSEHWRLSRDEEAARMHDAVASIEKSIGVRPRGWNSRNSPSEHTRNLVVQEGGFVYDSDAYNDDLPYFVSVGSVEHLVIPYSIALNDIRFAQSPGYSSPGDFSESCIAAFDYLWDEGSSNPRMMSVGLHARWSGQPHRTGAIRDFIEHAIERGNVWFARRIDIAEHWLAHSSDFPRDQMDD